MSQTVGFILYSPKATKKMELIQIDPGAQYILSSLRAVQTKRNISPMDISSLCKKWKGLFDKRSNDKLWDQIRKKGSRLKSHEEIIDFFQSGKRYSIKGTVFSDGSDKQAKANSRWLFALEKIYPESMFDLQWFLRDLKLNRREHEIIKLLLKDRNNKEIAQNLGISINTVKGYLKLLMKKLGVNSRTGIIASLMTGISSSSAPARA